MVDLWNLFILNQRVPLLQHCNILGINCKKLVLKVKISGNNSRKFLDISMRSLIMWWVMIEKPELTKVEAERYSKTNSD